jgi:hypothetical protein
MKIYSANLGGESFNADETKEFVSEMFTAYEEGFDSMEDFYSKVENNTTGRYVYEK